MADDLIHSLQNMSLKEVKRELVGSYCWMDHSKICIPGFPPKLKSNYKTVPIGHIENNDPATLEDAHPNEAFHGVYFEPLEQVLNFSNPKLSVTSFDLVTDRNNIRKLNAALEKDMERYTDFEIFARKIGNTLVLKRESDSTQLGTRLGKEFEARICNHADFKSCHMLVRADFLSDDSNPVSVLIRCEIDACLPNASTLSMKDYKLDSTTEDNLQVFRPVASKFPELQLSQVRELTMSANLKWSNIFQSSVVGVPAIVHGVKYRKETKIEPSPKNDKVFKEAVNAALRFGAKMEERTTYKIFRREGGPLEFEEATDACKWFSAI